INAGNADIPRASATPLSPLALRWTALDTDDMTLAAFLSLNQARNWTEFTAALRLLVAPSQNFVYADVDGHIGYYAAGRIPVRGNGDGTVPTDSNGEWTGWVPFDALPHAFDPVAHMLVTANNRPTAGDRYFLGVDWQAPYRAERITEQLRSKAT